MFHIVLFEPEIPPNTGNVIRLAANTGCTLHLVKPLGFSLGERRLQRAGLDYHDLASVIVHDNWERCAATLGQRRMFALTTKGHTRYDEIRFAANDVFVFGPETRGLPRALLDAIPPAQLLRVPMSTRTRSLNLANSVAIVVYEAWRQLEFAARETTPSDPRPATAAASRRGT